MIRIFNSDGEMEGVLQKRKEDRLHPNEQVQDKNETDRLKSFIENYRKTISENKHESDENVNQTRICHPCSPRSPCNFKDSYMTPTKFPFYPADHSELSSIYGDNSDWMLAERVKSRSPPTSPEMASLPDGAVFQFPALRKLDVRKRLFGPQEPENIRSSVENYSPEELDVISWRQNARAPSPRSPRQFRSSPVQTSEGLHYPSTPREEICSRKRQLSEEDCCSPPPKRRNTHEDADRDIAIKYLHQLKSDVSLLRHKLRNPDVQVLKPSNCTCAVMERQFIEIAESAYKSIRRLDSSPKGFEQFKRELLQTNEVIKDSLAVLTSIKQFCEHHAKDNS